MQILTQAVQEQLASSSWIRRMFEKGMELKKEHGTDKVFDFSLGNPDLPPPACAVPAMHQLAELVAQPFGMGYCPNAGLPEFRAALATALSSQQRVALKAAHVLVTCGAAGALTSLFRAILEPGDEVICPAPCFVEYGSYCGHFGGVLRMVPALLPDFQPDVAAIEAAITDRTRVLLINSPNNPAGCVYSQATLQKLADIVNRVNRTRQRPLFLLSDEPYRFLAYDNIEVPPILPLSPFAVVLGSFSKSLSMAGERIGYLIANPEMPDVNMLMSAVTLTNRTLGFVNAPVLGQRLAMALINEGVDIAIYARRRAMMAEVLAEAGIAFAMPQGAFYFFPSAPGGDDQAFTQALLQQKVLAVPGRGFGFAGHFRLSFSVAESVIERSAPNFKAAVNAIVK